LIQRLKNDANRSTINLVKIPYGFGGTMRNHVRALATLSSLMLCCGMSNCPPKTQLTITPLDGALEQIGFIALGLPDNKERPGAVVSVTSNAGGEPQVRWLADIRSCGSQMRIWDLPKGPLHPSAKLTLIPYQLAPCLQSPL
jgi:hypothetical protein